jgi:hypothetical protein
MPLARATRRPERLVVGPAREREAASSSVGPGPENRTLTRLSRKPKRDATFERKLAEALSGFGPPRAVWGRGVARVGTGSRHRDGTTDGRGPRRTAGTTQSSSGGLDGLAEEKLMASSTNVTRLLGVAVVATRTSPRCSPVAVGSEAHQLHVPRNYHVAFGASLSFIVGIRSV